jgi:hypothetical protein
MDQIWHRSEVFYRDLLKTASSMLRRQIARNFRPFERYAGNRESLALDVVIETIERVKDLERSRGPASNLLGRCYRVMYYVICDEAHKLWNVPKPQFIEDMREGETEKIGAHDLDLDAIIWKQFLEKLRRFINEELPRHYEEARDEAFGETQNQHYNDPQFLPCAIARLSSKPAREAWKPFEGKPGGSWQNMEKLYTRWRKILRAKLMRLGWEVAVLG